ncbi:hypothetical protein [Psychrobacter sp. I-STPA10]|uniref:hypothetical protein n=1 Tax=Psychrobacter sp. I-STPA10 TaxID=2585769 RepID=UPI001E6232B5|nr:hypothetical protein [Psychrobacter sp. I-STPA10]
MKVLTKTTLTILSLSLATSSYAICDNLFSCTVKSNHKKVQVCDRGNGYINYRFGKNLNKPEISLTQPYRKTSISNQWYTGRFRGSVLSIPNGNTTYSLFHYFDSFTDTKAFQTGIDVIVNDEYVAKLECIPHSVESNLANIDYLPEVH